MTYNRNHYINSKGKEKSLLKYYKRLYKENNDAMTIIKDTNLNTDEKLKRIKIFHYTKKIQGV